MLPKNKSKLIYFIPITTIIILILVAFVTYFVFRYRKNQIIYLTNLNNVKLGYEKLLLEIQLEIQEATLDHLSKEIHDNCSQKLSLAKLQLNTLNFSNQKLLINQVESAINILSQVNYDLANLSHSMSSEILFQNGLVSALENEIFQLKKLKIFRIEWTLKGEETLIENKKELVLFRIAQEAIHNIIKHSRASFVHVQLEFTGKEVILNISDNGVGFSINETKSNGIGLQNMAQRTRLMNGEFQIESIPSKGTIINSKIPL